MKILIIAESANPEWVSVPLVGWSLASALRKEHQVHIVTQIRNRDAFVRAGLQEGVDFTAIDTENILRPLWKITAWLRGGAGVAWTTQTAVTSILYPYFEYKIWIKFKDSITSNKYDIVHRITPLTPTAASPLARKCAISGIPFILGPLNGGAPWPKGFGDALRQEKEWLAYVRFLYKLLPGTGSTTKHSSAIIVGSLHTHADIPKKHHHKTFYLPENAVDLDRFSRSASDNSGVQNSTNNPIKLAFVGRLVPYKGPDMLIEAAAPLLREGKVLLDIIGDGPMMQSLKNLVSKEHVSDFVTLHGWLEHNKVSETLQRSQILAFPSIREFGGGVVLEAMALGVVPLVVDYAGPGELVDDAVGWKIPIGSRSEIVERLRNCLIKIASNPNDINTRSVAAIKRVRQNYTWSAKASQLNKVYDWVLDCNRAAKPNFDLLKDGRQD